MQIRLYIDEDAMSRVLVNGLRARGVDVKTVLDDNKAGFDDAELLEFAAEQNRVLYTCNISDFYRIHSQFMRENKEHAGIILVPQQRYSVGEQIRRILALISVRSSEAMKNQIEFLSSWG